jgi:uncharacterized Zn finger protein
MTVEIEFLCPRCGLLTPGVAEVPPEVKPHTKMTFHVKCFHCGRNLTKVTTPAKAARRKP